LEKFLYGKRKDGVPQKAHGIYTNVYSVFGWDDRVAGANPDRNIRFQLMRDAFASEN
jgi:hypothetical protein